MNDVFRRRGTAGSYRSFTHFYRALPAAFRMDRRPAPVGDRSGRAGPENQIVIGSVNNGANDITGNITLSRANSVHCHPAIKPEPKTTDLDDSRM